MKSEATGRCLCGAVTFTAKAVDTHVHSCHCNKCRKWSGASALAANVGDIAFSGEDSIERYDSSSWAERGFCKRCGTHLFYRLKEADQYVVWMGAFDDPAPFQLVGEIFVDEKPPGYEFAGDHPRMTGAEFMASIGMGEPG